MAENQAEKGTNPSAGMVLSRMDASDEIWPTRCGADYVAHLAKPQNWAVAVAACQMRAGYDIGEGGRAIVDNMPVSGARIGSEWHAGSETGTSTGLGIEGAVRSNTRRSFFRQVFPGIALVNGFSIWEAVYDLQWGWACAFSLLLAFGLVVNEDAKRFEGD